MNAPDYLRALQRTEELFYWFLAYVPPHSGGSDLQRFPPWLEQQLSSVGIALSLPPMQRFRLLLEKCDWARNTFTELQPRFTEDERHQLTLGENFTIGTSHSAEFNGAVVQAPTAKTCIVIVLPIGAMLLADHVAMLTTLHSPGILCQILVNGGHEDVGFREGPIVRQLRKAAPRWAIRTVRQRYPTRQSRR